MVGSQRRYIKLDGSWFAEPTCHYNHWAFCWVMLQGPSHWSHSDIHWEIHLQDVRRARCWHMQQSSCEAVLYRSCAQNSPTNLRCNKVPHHAQHTIKQVSWTKHTCHVLIFCLSLKWDRCTWMATKSHGSYLCRQYRNHVGSSPHMAVQMDVIPNAATVWKFARSASKCVLVRDVLTSVEIFTTTRTTLRTGIEFSHVDWSTWNSRL